MSGETTEPTDIQIIETVRAHINPSVGHALVHRDVPEKVWYSDYDRFVIDKLRKLFATSLARQAGAAGQAVGGPGGATEVLAWLECEVSAVSCRYQGDPAYDHDAYWMKDRVKDLIKQATAIFAAPTPPATASDALTINATAASAAVSTGVGAELAEMSRKATPGLWSLARPPRGYEYVGDRGQELHGAFQNVSFIVALVNAYRAGQLVATAPQPPAPITPAAPAPGDMEEIERLVKDLCSAVYQAGWDGLSKPWPIHTERKVLLTAIRSRLPAASSAREDAWPSPEWLLNEALTKIENDRAMWSEEWLIWANYARSALKSDPTPGAPEQTGGVGSDEGVPCERCQGNGEIVTDWNAYLGEGQPMMDAVDDCPDCDGTGRVECSPPPHQDGTQGDGGERG